MIKARPKTARQVAAFTLFSIEEDGAWSDGALHHYLDRAGLDRREAGLATQLVYGVLQNQTLCDWYMRAFSKLRLAKIAPRVRICLRLGIYQLLFTDRIPVHAAVDETVALIRSFGHANDRAVSFANGLLRSVAQAKESNTLPKLDCPDKASYFSLRYSHPQWLVQALIDQLGEKQTAVVLQEHNKTAPISVRINRLHAHNCDSKTQLEADGFTVNSHPNMDNIMLVEGGNLAAHPLFAEGAITVQDAASALCAQMAQAQPHQTVIDCCAAPGGKTFCLAEQMQNTGTLIACDVFTHKLDKILEGGRRLGVTNLKTYVQDARELYAPWQGTADVVLCDVPCSGFGIVRKKPEIRYRDAEDAAKLPPLQLEILRNASQYVKAGGTLVYSTCTILPQENEQVVHAFLAENPEFSLVPIAHDIFGEREQGYVTLYAGIHPTDGFFIAKMVKKGGAALG